MVQGFEATTYRTRVPSKAPAQDDINLHQRLIVMDA